MNHTILIMRGEFTMETMRKIGKVKRGLKRFSGFLKILIAWIYLNLFKRNLLRDDIWIIREKKDEARDNGYYFFSYLREKHPEINAYYIISMNSPDLDKVLQYGNIIKANSFQHCVYYLAAKYSISSQQFGAFPFSFRSKELLYIGKLCNTEQKVVFLQHGIIQNFLSSGLCYDNCNIDFFICSAPKEYQYIKDVYKYPEHAIGCVGLARFDNLYKNDDSDKVVLIMPTWRKWLACSMLNNIPTHAEKEKFLKSNFYKEFTAVLEDKELLEYLKNKKYKIVFYLHYKFQGFCKLFFCYNNDVVTIASKEKFDVQQLLKSSKVLVTDYSSVYFDFAYMNKPTVYFQFDKTEFEKGHYSEGYFSYENDGFGPCCKTKEEFKELLINIIENDCKQPEKYEQRVKDFFCFHDNKNCERTFLAIKNL